MEPPGSEMRKENFVEKSLASTCVSEKMLPAWLPADRVSRMTSPSAVDAVAAVPLRTSPVVSEKSAKSTTSAAANDVVKRAAVIAVRCILISL